MRTAVHTRIPLWAVALTFTLAAGLALAQGVQESVIHALVGPLSIQDSRIAGTKTLSGGSGSVTVYAGSKCNCSLITSADSTAFLNGCEVSGTTLSITETTGGAGADSVTYFCWTSG